MKASFNLREELYFRPYLFAAPLSEVAPSKTLSNPSRRMEIRADFPDVIHFNSSVRRIRHLLDQELRKQGTTLDCMERITLAYPHKHPELYPGHVNLAKMRVEEFRVLARSAAPHVQWIVADGLCETVHLKRSEDQTSLHALTKRQIYDIHRPSQETPCPFFEPLHTAKEFFMIVDNGIEQGTTIANLMSYITYNGGCVLGAAAVRSRALVQQEHRPKNAVSLSAQFNDPARNAKKLPRLAQAFSRSAKDNRRDWSPAACLDMFEQHLNMHGNSVFALTDGECERLIETMHGRYGERFPTLLKKLAKASTLRA